MEESKQLVSAARQAILKIDGHALKS